MLFARKTEEGIQLEQATALVDGVNALLAKYPFEKSHVMGRAYFQKEIVIVYQCSNLNFIFMKLKLSQFDIISIIDIIERIKNCSIWDNFI